MDLEFKVKLEGRHTRGELANKKPKVDPRGPSESQRVPCWWNTFESLAKQLNL